MPNEAIRRAFKGLPEAIRPAQEMRQTRRVADVVGDDGRLNRQALIPAVAASMVTFYVPGTVVTGTSVAEEIAIPQIGRLSRIDARLKTASSSGTVALGLSKNGASVKTISLAAGILTANSGMLEDVAEGDTLRLIVTTAGTGAVGLTVTVSWIPSIL